MFGDNLKKYRTEKGYSQSDIAGKLFVTRQCVSKWEKGITQPDLQTLTQLADLLEVSVDSLLKEENAENKQPENHNKGLFAANILTAVFCALAFTALWGFVPQTIPAHWTDGVTDRYGSRNEIFINLITCAALLATDAVTFFVLRRVSDKRAVYIPHMTIIFFQIAYLIFIVVLYAGYLNGAVQFAACLNAAIIMCGSVAMHPKISKRNYILGVRTAKTLKSASVWVKTNALACYLFSGWSLITYAVNIVVANNLCLLMFAGYIVLAAAVVIYSRRLPED